MKIKWYGHSMFELVSNSGVKIVIDPFDNTIGYNVPTLAADIVTVSHNHFDHNNSSAINGDFKLINSIGEFEGCNIKIKGIATFHDEEFGKQRGNNIVFKYTIDGINVCHMGDLGHVLNSELIEELKKTEILMIPVGGLYTIDSIKAYKVIVSLSPKIIVPMHYKTDKLAFDLERIENFTKFFVNIDVMNSTEISVDKNMLDNTNNKVMILNYI